MHGGTLASRELTTVGSGVRQTIVRNIPTVIEVYPEFLLGVTKGEVTGDGTVLRTGASLVGRHGLHAIGCELGIDQETGRVRNGPLDR